MPSLRGGSIAAAAASGDERALLVAMRDLIATDLDAGVPARDVASLTRRLLEVSGRIAAIDAAGKEDGVGAAASTADEAWTPTGQDGATEGT